MREGGGDLKSFDSTLGFPGEGPTAPFKKKTSKSSKNIFKVRFLEKIKGKILKILKKSAEVAFGDGTVDTLQISEINQLLID